jgi:dTDP-4-dehydrorhamnose 3,5-epimerase
MVLEAGEKRAVAIIIPAGVVHAYKNIGGVPGWSLNFPNSLYGGVGRKSEIDEIRYEDDPETLFRLD